MTDTLLSAVQHHRASKWGAGPVTSPTDAALYRAVGLDAIEIRPVAARPSLGRLYGGFEHVLPDGTVTRDARDALAATGWGVRPAVEDGTDNARATDGPAAVALGGVAAAVGGDTAPGGVTALAPLPGPLLAPEQMAGDAV